MNFLSAARGFARLGAFLDLTWMGWISLKRRGSRNAVSLYSDRRRTRLQTLSFPRKARLGRSSTCTDRVPLGLHPSVSQQGAPGPPPSSLLGLDPCFGTESPQGSCPTVRLQVTPGAISCPLSPAGASRLPQPSVLPQEVPLLQVRPSLALGA